MTVFVYDGHPGGAGFAERGYAPGGGLAEGDPGGDRRLRVRHRAAPRACSRPSAATATSRWTRHGAVRLLDVVLRSGLEG